MSLMMMPMKLIVTSNTPVIAVDHTTTLFRINRFPILPKRKVQLRNVQKTWAGGRWQGQGVRTIILENLLVYLHPWPSFCSMTCPPLCSKLQMPLFHFLRIKKKKKTDSEWKLYMDSLSMVALEFWNQGLWLLFFSCALNSKT